MDEPEIVEKALAGDREAFRQWVERHQDFVYRVAFRILGIVTDMAALSIVLVTVFFIQHSEAPRMPGTPSLKGDGLVLNTASFHEALVSAKKNGTGRTGLYECVVSCLQAHDDGCDQCIRGFAKPK